MKLLTALASGLLFGVGLGLSGMTQPAKVLGFLDLGGAWDPSLLFVMGGALAVYAVLFPRIRRRARPVLAPTFHLPPSSGVDRRLVLGAGIFGVGWGLGGFCPGPSLVTAASGALPAIAFVAAMALGMAGHARLTGKARG